MARKTTDLQLLGDTLTRQYRLACELYNTFPIGRITHQLSQGNLFINLSTVDHDHLEALCHLLQNKVTPQMLKLSIPSSVEVGTKILQQAVRGISLCTSQSYTLTSLELSHIKLKGNNLDLLCQGLSKSRNLKTLSFISCGLHDTGTKHLCQSIKNVPSISELSLIDCSIPENGAVTVAGLLKHQRLNRDSAMWQDTLRLRHPHLDGMRGLRRITLNCNPQLGDFGAKALAEALLEDLWIKALDLQHCGIGEEGGLAMKEILKTNHTLEVLDLRKNPFVPSQVVNEVISALNERQEEYNSNQYMWLSSEIDQTIDEGNKIKLKGPTRVYSPVKKSLKENSLKRHQKPQLIKKKAPTLPKQSGIPWRIEHRLYERKEGLKPGSFVDSLVRNDRATPVAPQDSELSSEMPTTYFRKIKKLLSHYRHLYHKEKEARKRIEQKLSKLQARINQCHMLDDHTFNHIETCFKRFQNFLINLKTAGFQWQAELWEDTSSPKQLRDMLLHNNSELLHPSNPAELDDNLVGVVPQTEIDLLDPSTVNLPIIFRNKEISEKDYFKENVSEPEKEVNTSDNNVELSENIPERENIIQVYDEDIVNILGRDVDTEKMQMSSYIESSDKSKEDSRRDGYITKLNQSEVTENTETSDPLQTEVELGSSSAEDHGSEAHSADVMTDYVRTCQEQVLEFVRNSSPIGSGDIIGTPSRLLDIQLQNGVNSSHQNLSGIAVAAMQPEKDTVSNTPEGYTENSSDVMNDHRLFSPHKTDIHERKIEQNLLNRNNSKYSSHAKSDKPPFENLVDSPKETKIKEVMKIKEQTSVVPTETDNSDAVDGPPYSQRSETDDEKLQMKKTIRLVARSGSISSVSITEHLSNSHSSWTKLGKPRIKKSMKYESINSKALASGIIESKKVVSDIQKDTPMEYDSDFEVSDVEGLSISASSLTSTTIPDDLVTPGEEEF